MPYPSESRATAQHTHTVANKVGGGPSVRSSRSKSACPSSLLVMLCAFAGERWRQIYNEALALNYRFLSFGDAMIVAKGE